MPAGAAASVLYLQAGSPNTTFYTRSGAKVSDANGLIQVTPYGDDLIDLLRQGLIPVPSDGGPVLPKVTGRFYGTECATLEAFLTVLGTMYAYPIFIPTPCTLASLNMSVTTGQTGGKARCALYADDGTGYPGAMVAGTDSGDLDGTATAVVTKGSLAVALEPGWYWVGSQFTASSTMPSVAGIKSNYTNVIAGRLGFDTAAHALATSGQAPTGVVATGQTYGAMPATFPATVALQLNADTPAVSIGL